MICTLISEKSHAVQRSAKPPAWRFDYLFMPGWTARYLSLPDLVAEKLTFLLRPEFRCGNLCHLKIHKLDRSNDPIRFQSLEVGPSLGHCSSPAPYYTHYVIEIRWPGFAKHCLSRYLLRLKVMQSIACICRNYIDSAHNLRIPVVRVKVFLFKCKYSNTFNICLFLPLCVPS